MSGDGLVITGADPNVRPDERDELLIAEYREAFDARPPGPRVGDWLIFPDGHEERFSHDWGDEIQTTDGKFGASFSLQRSGPSFSGGLNGALPKSRMRRLSYNKPGSFWTFHHDRWTAHNAVHFTIPVRVFQLDEVTPLDDRA